MEELCREFLIEAISKLENLQFALQADQFLSEEQERETFRTFHTLKGNSQAFNLIVSGKLAHELENLLQASRDKRISSEEFTTLFHQGINLLLETFQNAVNKKPVAFPIDFAVKVRQLIPDSSINTSLDIHPELSDIIAPELLKQFSPQEKDSLAAAIAGGDLLYLIEVGFDFAHFDEEYKKLRSLLVERGAIIANFPSAEFAATGKIGFQIFFVSGTDENEIAEITKPFAANVTLQSGAQNFSSDLKGVLQQAVSTGQKTARKLRKEIEFQVSTEEIELSPGHLKIISEALLHLVRNAVDHGIEASGKININVFNHENRLHVSVNDNGRGLDVEKIRDKAIAKNLIQPKDTVSDADLMKFIFRHGFSTSNQVSEVSGRGVGLDAVEAAAKKNGGEIHVESEIGTGTTFEIKLPMEI